MKMNIKFWRNVVAGLALVGLGAYAIATGKVEQGINAIMKGVETIGQESTIPDPYIIPSNGSEVKP